MKFYEIYKDKEKYMVITPTQETPQPVKSEHMFLNVAQMIRQPDYYEVVLLTDIEYESWLEPDEDEDEIVDRMLSDDALQELFFEIIVDCFQDEDEEE